MDVKDKLVRVEDLGSIFNIESEAREDADTTIIARINNIIAPEGDPSLAEVADARVSGTTTYANLSERLSGDKTAIDSDIAKLKADLGDLSELETTAKTDLVAAINEAAQSGGSGGGLTADIKEALLACFSHVAWDDDDPTGQSYIDALEDVLYPPAELVSISAVYTQSGVVYGTDSLDSLKTDLVVTATYDDTSTETITTYTLSGSLAEGTSTITVTYGGKTATFTVTVSHEVIYTQIVADVGTFIDSGIYANGRNSQNLITKHSDVYSITDVKAGDVILVITTWNTNDSQISENIGRSISTESNSAPSHTIGTFVKHGTKYGETPVTINEDVETLYVGISNEASGAYISYCTWTRESGF